MRVLLCAAAALLAFTLSPLLLYKHSAVADTTDVLQLYCMW
jgi:hypothetical protein